MMPPMSRALGKPGSWPITLAEPQARASWPATHGFLQLRVTGAMQSWPLVGLATAKHDN